MTGSQQRSSNLYIQRCFWVQRNGCQWRAQKHSNEWPWESSWEIAGAVLRSLCAPHNKNYSSFKPTVARWISKLYWSWSSWLRTNFLCPLDNFSQHNVEPSPGACAVPGLCCCRYCVPLLTLEEISVPHTFSWKENNQPNNNTQVIDVPVRLSRFSTWFFPELLDISPGVTKWGSTEKILTIYIHICVHINK